MKKYILKGLSRHAKTYLSIDDIESLRSMIGSEIELCDNFRSIYLLPDGGRVHSDYLIIEEVIEGMNPKGKGMTLMEFILDRNYPVVISADDGSTQFRSGLVEEVFEEYLSYRINDSLKPKSS